MKVSITKSQKLYYSYPNTVAVICVRLGERMYVMPAAWQTPLSYDPPIFGVLVSPQRFTFKKLLKAKNFSLNYFSYEHAHLITSIGTCSGLNTNKVSRFGIKLAKSKYINSPTLADAYVSFECDNVNTKKYGDHVLFAGSIRNIWYEDSYFKNGMLNTNRVKPLLYLGNMVYTSIDPKKMKKCLKKQS